MLYWDLYNASSVVDLIYCHFDGVWEGKELNMYAPLCFELEIFININKDLNIIFIYV